MNRLLFAFVAVAVVVGCGSSDTGGNGGGGSATTSSSSSSSGAGGGNTCPTYTADVAPIINSNCQSCHASQPPSLGTYDEVKASASLVQGAIDAGTMPKSGPLSAGDKATIDSWVSCGMPN
jgi:hypothetical protein